MPEALVRSLEKEVGMFLILVQTFRFVSSAMRLTTFMTTIRVCPLKSPKVRNPICEGNGTSADSLGHAADVWGIGHSTSHKRQRAKARILRWGCRSYSHQAA
jgi:hypothetical protein